MGERIGYIDVSDLAWRQAMYESEKFETLPMCGHCSRRFDPYDLIGGVCPQCAEEEYTPGQGKQYIAEHDNNWICFSADYDLDAITRRKEEGLIKEFCFDDFDDYRRFIYVQV